MSYRNIQTSMPSPVKTIPHVKPSGFGSNLANLSLHFAIAVPARGQASLYVRNGAPAREDWWRSSKPLLSGTVEQCREALDTLCEATDANLFFPCWVEI